MPTKKKKTIKTQLKDKMIIALCGVILLLVIACITLFLVPKSKDITPISENIHPTQFVSLGGMAYTIANDRATKRTDVTYNNIRTFLIKESDESRCGTSGSATGRGYFSIVAWTSDEKQLFLAYGCGSADAPMYAVNRNGTWKALSPTNQFDGFGIPSCTYLADNNISVEIAPVCANNVDNAVANGTPKYSVR